MGQSFKQIVIISAIIILVAGLIAVIYPHINYLNGDNIEKRIIIHQSSNESAPFLIESKGINFNVRIADDQQEREEGLSGTLILNDDEGVLFVYDEPGYYQMWMKRMLFSLDIIWLDKGFNVVDIKKNLSPDTYPASFGPKSKAQYVLEINSGLSDKYGFMIGDQWHAVNSSNDI